MQELAASPSVGTSGMGTPGPPSYEVITQAQGSNELPPPSYAEAVSLLRQAGINGKFHEKYLREVLFYFTINDNIFPCRYETGLWDCFVQYHQCR